MQNRKRRLGNAAVFGDTVLKEIISNDLNDQVSNNIPSVTSVPHKPSSRTVISKAKSKDTDFTVHSDLGKDVIFMVLIHFIIYLGYTFISIHHHDDFALHNYGRYQLRPRQSNQYTMKEQRKYNAFKIVSHELHEPGYPKITGAHYFPTYASEQEMAKHDRYIVHGILYTDMLSSSYIRSNWNLPTRQQNKQYPWIKGKVCINIFVRNGPIPYINALIMTLMGSHENKEGDTIAKRHKAGQKLLSYTKLNILDIERGANKNKYDDIRKKVMHLPFIHYNSVPEIETSQKITSARLNKIQDYLASANICVQSKMPWCLMMEEHTVVPTNFLESLQRFVTAPLESFLSSHLTADKDIERVAGEKFSVLSLFSSWESKNHVSDGRRRRIDIGDILYSRTFYDKDRSFLNSERKALGIDEYHAEYEMFPVADSDAPLSGNNVAMFFRTSSVKERLIPFLKQMEQQEKNKLFWRSLSWFPSVSLSDEEESVPFDLEVEFAHNSGLNRYELEPSLVNRIGFYDDQLLESDHQYDTRLHVSNWNTDPRFLFEPGEYWEDIDYFCEDGDDGKLLYDTGKVSVCNKKKETEQKEDEKEKYVVNEESEGEDTKEYYYVELQDGQELKDVLDVNKDGNVQIYYVEENKDGNLQIKEEK